MLDIDEINRYLSFYDVPIIYQDENNPSILKMNNIIIGSFSSVFTSNVLNFWRECGDAYMARLIETVYYDILKTRLKLTRYE